MNKKIQQGVGLIEVLVSLLLLSVVVLGFVALQVKAMEATYESNQSTQAMIIAKDLAERMRVNRAGQSEFQSPSPYNTARNVNCAASSVCTPRDMAAYDFAQVSQQARNQGMQMAVLRCPGFTMNRYCVYVAWDNTTATNGNANTDCTHDAAPVQGSKCVIMELYNYS